MGDCCLKGFRWTAQPRGRETVLANIPCYVTGSNANVAILVIHDLFGWTFPNIRLLADHYAEEVDATVYVPDFFGGKVLPLDILQDKSRWGSLDLPAFLKRNAKEVREPQIIECAVSLRAQYGRTGAIGYCFGGWGAFRLGAKGSDLVDCISTAHPSFLEKSEIESVSVPVQIMAPEFDPMFTEELKLFCNSVLPTLGIAYEYHFFPKLEHAFAVRGNPNDPAEMKGMRKAKDAAVVWFRQWLHNTDI